MLKRMKNKRGMTLIEMMVVIVIVAVLVSIVVPIIGNATTRANAATNAANLRSVAGQVATLKVTNPEIFELNDAVSDYVSEATTTANRRLDRFNEMLDWVANTNYVGDLIDWGLATFFDFDAGVAGLQLIVIETQDYLDTLNYKYGTCQTFYADNGVITIGDVTITAPTSNAVSIKDMEIKKGTEMTLVVSDTRIYASYDGITTEGFAILAQKGDTASATEITHNFRDSNGDTKCDLCGGAGGTDNCKKDAGTDLDDFLGGGHKCTSTDGDDNCDDTTCGLPIPCSDDNSDHKCDRCNKPLTTCNNSAANPKCSICGDILAHSYSAPGFPASLVSSNCTVCGEAKSHSSHQ